MKTYFIILFTIIVAMSAFSQGGELQFNQAIVLNGTLSPIKKVKTVSYGGATSTDTSFFFLDSVSVTVPSNKTLKLENVSTGGRTVIYNQNAAGSTTNIAHTFPSPSGGFVVGLSAAPFGSGLLSSHILLQNCLIYTNEGSGTSKSSNFPIWLPSGTYKFIIETPSFVANNFAATPNSIPYRKDARLYYFISGIEFNIIP